jgi:hypothetical protein
VNDTAPTWIPIIGFALAAHPGTAAAHAAAAATFPNSRLVTSATPHLQLHNGAAGSRL